MAGGLVLAVSGLRAAVLGLAPPTSGAYLLAMQFPPAIPTRGTRAPAGPDWLHEIKYHGFRLIVHRDGDRVRLLTRNGHNWSTRYPRIVESALKNRTKQFVIDGEAVVLGVDGVSDFDALYSGRQQRPDCDPERKASIAWAIRMPMLKMMNVPARAEAIRRLLRSALFTFGHVAAVAGTHDGRSSQVREADLFVTGVALVAPHESRKCNVLTHPQRER